MGGMRVTPELTSTATRAAAPTSRAKTAADRVTPANTGWTEPPGLPAGARRASTRGAPVRGGWERVTGPS
ncbi:hypothetical protein GCM10009818_00680 [Nakamurella flavida]